MYIIHKFLEYSALIKLYHWTTYKHSRHIATDALYSSIQDGMDKFIEVYIGIYERKTVFKGSPQSIELKLYNDKNASLLLDEIANFLKKDIPKYVKETDLLNIRDEILASVNKAKYLFTHE